jgi:hypothetical protein
VLIVASTTAVLVDVLRRDLLYNQDGLPVSLFDLLSGIQIGHFFSFEFWSGFGAYGSHYRRFTIGLAVLAAALSLLAGPVSATLLVPNLDTRWPAGAVKFAILGSPEGLYPQELNGNHTDSSACEKPTLKRLQEQMHNDSKCLWNGYSS